MCAEVSLFAKPKVKINLNTYKIAMEMIFNSAYTVIAAMLPLMVIGVGALKGFAITTMLGVIIAIVVTRPAYMSILEKIKKLH